MSRVTGLGLIPDGGRRWSKAKGWTLEESYFETMHRLGYLLESLYRHGVESVAVYLLSRANLKRPASQLESLEAAVRAWVTQHMPGLQERVPFRLAVVGETRMLGEEFRADLEASARLHLHNTRTLYLLLAYDPFEELLRCTRDLASAKTKDDVLRALSMPHRLDLVIRTGGAITLSEFLPLQSSYARLVFLDVLFNDLQLPQVMELVVEHERLSLRYGE